jgi:hypothetical protein
MDGPLADLDTSTLIEHCYLICKDKPRPSRDPKFAAHGMAVLIAQVRHRTSKIWEMDFAIKQVLPCTCYWFSS